MVCPLKHCFHLQLIRYRTLKDEFSDRGSLAELHRMITKSEDARWVLHWCIRLLGTHPCSVPISCSAPTSEWCPPL